MRGARQGQKEFVCFLNIEDRVSADHPIREVKRLADQALTKLSPLLDEVYAVDGRPSIPPERLLKAKVLQALYSVRSDRMFCERLKYDLLFWWFLDMNPDEQAFAPTTFTKNQDRLIKHRIAEEFLFTIVDLAEARGWVSNEHFSVDGTLIESWASLKSFRSRDEGPKSGDGNGWSDFKGEKRSNETHGSRTDPESKLARKGSGREAKLCFAAHAIMENRNGLCVGIGVTEAVGVTEVDGAVDQLSQLVARGYEPKTVGADKGYHSRGFIASCRELEIAPHVAEVTGRRVEGMDARTTGRESYKISLIVRRRIESIFGWSKVIGGLKRSRYKGVARNNLCVNFVTCAYNLLRMAKLATA